jgi:hypothetical protein
MAFGIIVLTLCVPHVPAVDLNEVKRAAFHSETLRLGGELKGHFERERDSGDAAGSQHAAGQRTASAGRRGRADLRVRLRSISIDVIADAIADPQAAPRRSIATAG